MNINDNLVKTRKNALVSAPAKCGARRGACARTLYSAKLTRMTKSAEALTRHVQESEKAIEYRLANKVRAIGGLCLKFASASMTGYPDRLVCLPGGKAVWVELKSKGKHPTRFQELRHQELREKGFEVYVADSAAAVDALVAKWRAER